MKKNFYKAFEDKYRGSRELIRGRLEFYRPFIEPLVAEFGRVPAIDLGCGRGEWLEVMLAAGFDARGIDLDAGMLQACVDLGLPAEKGEAIAHLRALLSKSQAIVSAFHVVEHIPFDALEDLVSEAKRVLLPGGLLILETPNPENITVATCSFYLDPTHQRPIPPNLLSFVAEHVGFERVKVIRLQESKELASRPELQLEDVLGGVSPDFSVVAQKKGKKSIMNALGHAFSQDYGLTLSGLSARYDAHMKGKAGEERLKLMQERFEAEKAALDSRLTTLSSEHSALVTNYSALVAEHDALATERSTLDARLSTLTAERDSLATECEALQQQLHEIHQANHGHWQLAESLKQELASKEKTWSEERSTLASRLSTLTAERNELATRHQLLATERAALASRIEEVAGEAAVARAQSESLRQELTAKEESLASMRETLAAERSAAELRLSTLSSEHSSLVAERNELATRHSLLATERAALAARIEEVAGEAAMARAQSESLRQELAAKEQAWSEERSTLASRLSALLAKRDSLATSHSLLATERDALSARLSTLVSERDELATRHQSLVTGHSTLVSEHQALHQANHGNWQLAESLKQELAAKEQAWSHERSSLDSQLLTLLAERDALATSHSLLVTEHDALLASTCWRITAPIRWARGGVRIPWPAPNEPLDDFFIKHAALYIRRRPHLKERALQFLFRNPKWHARVLPVLQGIRASTASPRPEAVPFAEPTAAQQHVVEPLLQIETSSEQPTPENNSATPQNFNTISGIGSLDWSQEAVMRAEKKLIISDLIKIAKEI